MSGIIPTYIISSTDLMRGGIYTTLHETKFRISGYGKRFCELKISAKQPRPFLFIVFANGDTADLREDIRQIRHVVSNSYIVLLLPFEAIGDPMSLLRLGASACLADNISADALLKSLDVVVANGVVIPPQAFRELLTSAKQLSDTKIYDAFTTENAQSKITLSAELHTDAVPHHVFEAPNLTDREAIILQMIVKGDTNKLIARGLNIAEATVKVHVKAILRKIRARNRTQAAIWAIRNGEQSHQSAETHFASAGE
jgi:two-component system nitrate/nitrite response regulator NarL